MSDETIELLIKMGVLGISVISFGLWINRNSRNHKLFDQFAAKAGLNVISQSGSFFFPATPHLEGVINGYKVSIVIQRKKGKWFGRWNYFTVLRVHGRQNQSYRFTVCRTNLVARLADRVIINEIETGYPDFDLNYTLNSNDQDIALRIFDQAICSDLVDNPDVFQYSGLEFSGAILEFREDRMVVNQAQMDRIEEILHFMVHLVEKTEKVIQSSTHKSGLL